MPFSRRNRAVRYKRYSSLLLSVIFLVSSFIGAFGSAPVSAQVPLRGHLDQVVAQNFGQSVFITGWACAPNEPRRILRIDVYNVGVSGGQITPDSYLGSLSANKTRESAVGDQCGGNRGHGFSGTLNGVCSGRNVPFEADLRVFAVYSDSPPINLQLLGANTTFIVFCPKA